VDGGVYFTLTDDMHGKHQLSILLAAKI